MIDEVKRKLEEKSVFKKKILDSYDCRILGTVNTFRIEYKDGVFFNKSVINKEVGGSVILPKDYEENFYIETQYRFPIRQAIFELPAGRLNEDEDFFTAANRELKEETGFTTQDMRKQIEYYLDLEFTTEKQANFVANGLKKDKTNLDYDEVINVLKVAPKTLISMIKEGTIRDIRTIIGIGYEYLYSGIGIDNDDIGYSELIEKLEVAGEELKETEVDIGYTYVCEFGFIQDHIVRVSNLKNSRRECVYLRRGNLVIPISKNNKIGIKVVKNYSIDKNIIALPQKLEFNDKKLEEFGSVFTAIGYSNKEYDIYILRNQEENDEYFWLTLEEVKTLMKTALIEDGKVLATLIKFLLV